MKRPPVLTIEQIKTTPKYSEYLKTMSYDEAKRAVQRDADWKYFKKIQDGSVK